MTDQRSEDAMPRHARQPSWARPDAPLDGISHTAPVFEMVSHDAELAALFRRYATRVSAGRDVVQEGAEAGSVIWVASGWIAASKLLSDGRRQIVDIAASGELLEYLGADGLLSMSDVTALTDTEAAIFPKSVFDRRCEDQAEMAELVEQLRAATRARRSQRLLYLGRGTARERISNALVELAVRARNVSANDVGSLQIPLQQKDIGDLVGLSAVHVCRTLRQLSRSGLLDTADTGVVIHDLPALAEICEIDLEQHIASITLGHGPEVKADTSH